MNKKNIKDVDLGISSFIQSLNKLKKIESYGPTGKKFEEQIEINLSKHHFRELSFEKNSTLFFAKELEIDYKEFENKKNELKQLVLDKKNFEPISNIFSELINNNHIYIYIYQPFGSQNFPDFLIITKDWIIPLEIKYSTTDKSKSLPKWNSNIPKPNSIYIFANPKEMTFFLGGDYVSPEIRLEYIQHFKDFDEKNKIKDLKNKILDLSKEKKDLINPFGLYPKIRIDYLESKEYQIGKEVFSKYNTIFEFSKKNNWEQNVIIFLERLDNENK